MELVPGGSGEETPREMKFDIRLLRWCVGLAAALWAAALTQPLADFTDSDWGVVQTIRVYPFDSGQAPGAARLFVWGAFLAIVGAGVAVGTLSSQDKGIRKFGGVLAFTVFTWCFFGAILFFSTFTGTVLAGMWLILISILMLFVAALDSGFV
ncbi:hypothetical protein ACFYV7_23395 [Nocardia suismassiliense]|uniref:Uncharacterized protein n=1 Tax=Nocardia suismassiliense TaxID=2077092 RepID=A0ABW6QWX6_9NOCA